MHDMLVKVNNRNPRRSCEICLKLTVKTPERRQWHFTLSLEANGLTHNVQIVRGGWENCPWVILVLKSCLS